MEQVIAALAVALGASFTSGINLYATVFVLGTMSRYSSFDLPGNLMVLESHWVMWPALTLYIVEFFADKFPAVDSTWDSIQTFIRIPAGVAIAATALGDVPLEFQIFAGLVGGTLATVAHGTKATTRLVAHTTGTSPVVSPVASVVEDVAVIGTTVLVAANPLVALLVVFVMLIGCIYVLRCFWRVARGVFRGLARLFRGPNDPQPTPA